MAKWPAATIVNYRVIAEFSGEAVLFEVDGITGRGTVTDRFEVEFEPYELTHTGEKVLRARLQALRAVTRVGHARLAEN